MCHRPVGGTVTLLFPSSCRRRRHGQGVWASKAARSSQPSRKKHAGAFSAETPYPHIGLLFNTEEHNQMAGREEENHIGCVTRVHNDALLLSSGLLSVTCLEGVCKTFSLDSS